MKKKQFYEKPSMKVFKLRQKPQLLQASGSVGATMTGTWGEEDVPEP